MVFGLFFDALISNFPVVPNNSTLNVLPTAEVGNLTFNEVLVLITEIFTTDLAAE